MNVAEELQKSLEAALVSASHELSVSVVAIVEQARQGLLAPTMMVWEIGSAPDYLKAYAEAHKMEGDWIAIVPKEVTTIPMFEGSSLRTSTLADGRRVIVGS